MPLIFWYFQNICVYVCACRCVNVRVLACACEKWSTGANLCVCPWMDIHAPVFMLSRLFHCLDEAQIHRPPDTLSYRRWRNVLLPASVPDFFTKKGNGKLVAAWGRAGALVVEVGECGRQRGGEKEREDVHIWSCSMALSLGGSAPLKAPFEFIRRRRQAGRWWLTGRVRGRQLTVSYGTRSQQAV